MDTNILCFYLKVLDILISGRSRGNIVKQTDKPTLIFSVFMKKERELFCLELAQVRRLVFSYVLIKDIINQLNKCFNICQTACIIPLQCLA